MRCSDGFVTVTAQAASVCTAVLCLVYRAPLDNVVAQLWTFLLKQWWFRHDTFEPALSVACFLGFLLVWYSTQPLLCPRYPYVTPRT